MKLSIGPPVQGDDFFDREKELFLLWDKLQHGHVLMLAPRRIGKTSILQKLIADADQHNFQAADICYFARCQNEFDCVNEIIQAVSKKHTNFIDVFKNRLDRIKSVNISLSGMKVEFDPSKPAPWQEVGKQLTETLTELGGNWLIPVDELPVFVLALLKQEDGLNRSHHFLDWFRVLRQEHNQTIHWILAGSIGLDTVTARLKLGDTINDLTLFSLGAFDNDVAQQFLRELSASYTEIELSDEVIAYMIARVGWSIPYYLQLLFSTMRDQIISSATGSSKADQIAVDKAFNGLLEPANKSYFDYWRQRLNEELEQPDAGYALLLLNAICRDKTGVNWQNLQQVLAKVIQNPEQKDDKLGYLIDVLENDGYLIEDQQRYRFRLEWLRAYWLKRVAR